MQGIVYALFAAILFGVSTPLAKWLINGMHPVMLAGLLYLGSGIGLGLVCALRRWVQRAPLTWPHRSEWLSFVMAICLGGVIAPVLLMVGLKQTLASSSALLLNLESVLTALLAWFVYKENVDRRIAVGMIFIVAGSVILSWNPGTEFSFSWGELLIIAACVCWAADNNLTRKVSHGDAVLLATIKGLVAGTVNLLVALAVLQTTRPDTKNVLSAMAIGWFGYGISLSLFVLALRHLGAARTGAYFSIAPFMGAATAILFLHEPLTLQIGVASSLMIIGIWLHLTEQHEHEHTHEFLEHEHMHTHDAHHQHSHAFPWRDEQPHTHAHRHQPMTHRHPHYPDIHHQHTHS